MLHVGTANVHEKQSFCTNYPFHCQTILDRYCLQPCIFPRSPLCHMVALQLRFGFGKMRTKPLKFPPAGKMAHPGTRCTRFPFSSERCCLYAVCMALANHETRYCQQLETAAGPVKQVTSFDAGCSKYACSLYFIELSSQVSVGRNIPQDYHHPYALLIC